MYKLFSYKNNKFEESAFLPIPCKITVHLKFQWIFLYFLYTPNQKLGSFSQLNIIND